MQEMSLFYFFDEWFEMGVDIEMRKAKMVLNCQTDFVNI